MTETSLSPPLAYGRACPRWFTSGQNSFFNGHRRSGRLPFASRYAIARQRTGPRCVQQRPAARSFTPAAHICAHNQSGPCYGIVKIPQSRRNASSSHRAVLSLSIFM
ncbi:hypothetical protein TNIN_199671 [Trichonephila inaurata madagascariensis]|uniref:Uncharacterized protein n=1 Tax=Trichonephila inaurata madagascariensis TaxID=2747483 RepID=A0A8X6XJW3_9ARAC|nr:hypothetical protein TNIN_199671 [Trichonephila inaurata madagascariensis]